MENQLISTSENIPIDTASNVWANLADQGIIVPIDILFTVSIRKIVSVSDIEILVVSEISDINNLVYCDNLDICIDFIVSNVVRIDFSKSVVYYIFTLTGSQDGTTDIEIPIASFQGRLRSGEQSYLSVVIPYTDDYADYISARPNGDLKVDMAYKIEGTLSQRETIALVHLDNIRIDRGGKNASITLSGYRQETYTQKTVTLTDSTYYKLSGGKKTYRFATPNMDLNPGDVVNVDDDSLTADLITYAIGTNTQQMEISEQ